MIKIANDNFLIISILSENNTEILSENPIISPPIIITKIIPNTVMNQEYF